MRTVTLEEMKQIMQEEWSKIKSTLEETVIEGVDTNIDFLFKIIKNPTFIRGNFDTSFIEKEILK